MSALPSELPMTATPDLLQREPSTRQLTAEIVAAYVSRNNVAISDLVGLIQGINTALVQAGHDVDTGAPKAPDTKTPAVAVRSSVTKDAIICLEDGRSFKSLRRHLRVQYNMTPEQYRVKWGLPANYPMVAPAYSEKRSRLAKEMGLGRR